MKIRQIFLDPPGLDPDSTDAPIPTPTPQTISTTLSTTTTTQSGDSKKKIGLNLKKLLRFAVDNMLCFLWRMRHSGAIQVKSAKGKSIGLLYKYLVHTTISPLSPGFTAVAFNSPIQLSSSMIYSKATNEILKMNR